MNEKVEFIGESPDEDNPEEEPDLTRAIHRAADKAGDAGYGGRTFDLRVQIDLKETNQWVKTYRVIITTE